MARWGKEATGLGTDAPARFPLTTGSALSFSYLTHPSAIVHCSRLLRGSPHPLEASWSSYPCRKRSPRAATPPTRSGPLTHTQTTGLGNTIPMIGSPTRAEGRSIRFKPPKGQQGAERKRKKIYIYLYIFPSHTLLPPGGRGLQTKTVLCGTHRAPFGVLSVASKPCEDRALGAP